MKRFILILLLCLATVPASASTLNIPAETKSIESEAFYGDTSLDTVLLPDGITTIGPRAFANSSLKSINLPGSLLSISDNALPSGVRVSAVVGTPAYDWAVRNGYIDELVTINWADFEPLAERWGGQFYELLDLQIYIPADMFYVEEDDFFAAFSDADETKMVGVLVEEADNATLEDFGAAMEEAGATDIEYCIVNGLPGVSFSMDNVICLSFLTDGDYIMFIAGPYSEEDLDNPESFAVQAGVILASIQAASE